MSLVASLTKLSLFKLLEAYAFHLGEGLKPWRKVWTVQPRRRYFYTCINMGKGLQLTQASLVVWNSRLIIIL